MKISLNLATRPYIELRPILARLRTIALVLFVLALPMLLVLHVEETKASIARAKAQQLTDNIAELQTQQARVHALAQQGENAATFNQADFLNSTFRRKGFSWTATMTDLENTLPAGVQVMVINPVIAPDGHVDIQLRVAGPRDKAVDVVRNLEHSKHFAAPRLVAESLAEQNAARPRYVSGSTTPAAEDVTFDILSAYRPIPSSHSTAETKKEIAEKNLPELTNSNGTVPETAPTRSHRAKARPAEKPSAAMPAGGAR